MKKFTLLTLLCAAIWRPVAAQTVITIAAARAQQPTTNATAGATVTVRGVATNGNELGPIRYFQDSQAGIAAYGGSTGTTAAVKAVFDTVLPGDSIQVTGQLKQFYGFLEIDPITNVTIIAGNRPVVPVSFPAGSITPAFAEQYEAMLVRINGITSINTAAGAAVTSFASIPAGYRINNSAATPLYINAASTGPYGLIGKPAPTGLYDAIGLISQHMTSNTGAVNQTTGYQLLPRLYADFLQGLTPNLIGTPTPSNITTTGFTVNYLTQNSGTTKVYFSTLPNLPRASTDSVFSTANTTAHSIALSGLQPATVYYVQAISVNSVGRSQSRVIPMITQSLSTGKMRVYFNNAVDNTLALPGNNAVYLPNGHIADTLASYINKARKTLDIAIYNWNNTVILNSVNAAYARGVKVRVIYEDDNANVSIGTLNAAIPRVGRPNQTGSSSSAIMHNKFVIIDADTSNANVPWVWTGSTNWTAAQLATDRNSAIAIQDQSLARVYAIEFNEMWGSTTLTSGTLLFGNRKTDNTPHFLRIGGRDVQSYFSPTDNVNGRLIETVQTADNDLHFASMLITRADIARAIRDRVQLRNIAQCTEGVTNDTASTDGSGNNFRVIRSAIGNRMILKRGSYIFHHKYLLVDAGASQSDPTIFLGSHNWTNSADNENDENTLVIHDNRIVNQYYQEFSTRVSEQNAGVAVCRLVLATRNGSIQASTLQAYPNPNRGSFSLHLASTTARTATIVLRDVTGRVVLTQTQPLIGTDLTIDATALKPGLYLVQVTTPEAVQTSRVVVE
ncbi:phospholipase D-like domain-containing protein [Hymenobacter terricola]|uniref:phospholipase D-like domain-containing protein n=1 Tax=Hymenobacter terricola TaxID=2819236 RepID=UPI001B3145E2|nr:phospholipase D-like domain-containing protein [Hymenobacter terricola]